jgi:23S rRNA (adenine2030-N6)-methyltransferase
MLSYRHGFHAGNHADVLKHLVQVLSLDHMLSKETGISYIDTHAGAGYYTFDDAFAAKNREFDTGITRLQAQTALPASLQRYLDVVELCRRNQPLGYPGSPAIALAMLRPQDRAQLFELHPADYKALQQRFYRRANIQQADGFTGIKALLPPPSRRAMLLMDPPFEVKTDYQTAVASLKTCLKRFSSGVYALWYPLLAREESQSLAEKLKGLAADNWLHCSLEVTSPDTPGAGMYGSAMFVINPPWRLAEQLNEALPLLAQILGDNDQGTWELEYQGR